MRNFYNKGGPTLTKAQQTLPPELKKKILMSKGKKKKSNYIRRDDFEKD